ncbi:sulfatase [Limibacter armeniacum]|uniref:sulfatase n=1 Tax=Limibacter armeniacum TaxID=466084 RepID=UPI002FE6090B
MIGLILSLIHISVQAQGKPNVLFIAIDDLNDYINCMNGAINIPTPNIDRLARQGTLFTNAHCQAPICGPSRASIMTGLYPSSSGNYLHMEDQDIRKSNELTSKAVFMPDFFEANGYKTMGVGKIYHNGDDANTFQEYGGKFSWMGPKPQERIHYDPYKMEGKRGYTGTDWGIYPEHDSLMTDYKSAEWTVERLQEHHPKPFFLAVGFVRPHVPWHAPKKWFEKFPLDSIQTPPYLPDDFEDIPPFAQIVTDVPAMPTTEELIQSDQWKNVIQAYMACVAFVDAQVGKVLDALETSDYANNTIVVLWSDHGYHLGEKNRFAKQALWERDTRAVLILKGIKSSEGVKCDRPVELLDIYPTLTDMCSLPPYPLAEGHSLREWIEGKTPKWSHPAITFDGKGNISIRSERYRLIQYEDQSLELYDLLNDANEWSNLADQPEFQHTVSELKKYIPVIWADLSEYSKLYSNEYFSGKSNGE